MTNEGDPLTAVTQLCDELIRVLETGAVPDRSQRQALDAVIAASKQQPEMNGAWFALNAAASWLQTASDESAGDREMAVDLSLDQLKLVHREIAWKRARQ